MKRKGNVLIIVALAGMAGASYKIYRQNVAEEKSHEVTGKTFATKIAEAPKPEDTGIPLFPSKEETLPSTDASAEESENSQLVNSEEIKEDLNENLLKDEKIQAEAEISSIDCNQKGCKIEAEPKKEDDSGFQMAFVKFLQAHPEFGNKMDIKQSGNTKMVSFVYYSRD